MTFGERLRKCRKEKNLTQRELGKIIGVKNNSVSNWEKDQNLPSASNVFALTRALGVTLEDLTGHWTMNDIILIGEKPFESRTLYERLLYNIFHEYSAEIGRGLKAANGSFEEFTQAIDAVITDHISDLQPNDAALAKSLQEELRGIVAGYSSLNDEGKAFVRQSLKTALAAYTGNSEKKGE